jgi:glycosyltransferase involved in cell wall biosynthesis
MKTLHIITSLHTGGAEKLLVDSIPIYKQKGIDVDLLLISGNETPFYEQLESKGTTIYSLTKGSLKKRFNPLLPFRIIPYLKRYDVVHAHLFPTLYWVALAKWLSRSKVNLVFTEHSTNNQRITKKGVWQILDKLAYRQYDRIGSITSEVQAAIQVHLADMSDKFRVINNGIDVSQYNNAASYDRQDKNPKVLMQVAGFREQKDQPTVIRALQHLPENVVVQFVGDGVLRTQCEQLVNDLNLSDRVSFLGIRTDVPELLKSADIVVMSSHWEGFGLAAVEGMAAGKPTIASNVAGLREVVSGAGLLFEKGDEKDLAEKVVSLLNDDELYEKVAQQCSERAKQYDINTMVDKYIELYNELKND